MLIDNVFKIKKKLLIFKYEKCPTIIVKRFLFPI